MLRDLRPVVLNTTLRYIVDRVYSHRDVSEHERYALFTGLDRLMQMFDPDRLRRSLVNRMPAITASKIMDIIDKRLEDPKRNPPLRVMIFGGSITEGMEANFFQQGDVSFGISRVVHVEARFSSQLQAILDTVLSPGVVEITNMASGGSTSEAASPLLEYAIYPEGYARIGPDLIISSFGFEEMRVLKTSKEIREANEQFIDAAYVNRCDGLPAVILVDDIFCNIISTRSTNRTELVSRSLKHSRVVSDIATWNDIMAVSYTRAFMHYAYADPSMMDDPMAMRKYREVLFGHARFSLNPPLLYHSGMAWMLAFQLLQTIGDRCQDEEASLTDCSLSVNKLDPRLMPRYYLESPLSNVTEEWWNHLALTNNKCSDPDFRPGNSCSLSWIAHRSSPTSRKVQLRELLLSLNASDENGWSALGNPIRAPKTGWFATRANATFSILVRAKEFPIRKVSFLYVKSSSREWESSRVNVTLTVVPDMETEVHGELDGVHDAETAIVYKSTFDVDVKVGETMNASFALVGGSMFKFTGMLFCSR
jgi:hypothetical protein